MTNEINYHHIVNKQRDFFNTGKTLSVDFRIDALKKLKDEIVKQEFSIEEALKDDLGKSSYESYIGELGAVLLEIDFHIKRLKKWTKSKRVKTPLFLKPSRSRIMYEPYGVSLIISPWNYPFQLAIMPLIGAISAGNTALIKPSEHAPETSIVIKKILDACFDPAYISVVKGGIDEVTCLLKERFDFIFFTGSNKVGKIVARAASEHLSPVVLELGGKSPVIFDNDFPMKLAAKRIMMAKCLNSGQTCVAPDYVLIPKNRKEEFVRECESVLREFFPNSDLEKVETYKDITRIVNKEHYSRVKNLLDGEDVLWGGKCFEEDLKIQPTLIDSGDIRDYLENRREKTSILKEEIFALLLPILTYEDINDVIRYVKQGEKPLSLYLYSNDKMIRERVLKNLSFGGGCVNDSLIHLSNHYLPFGGVGASGQGTYHGKESFLTFSHKKSLLYSSSTIDFSFKYMPYTAKKFKLVKKIFK